MSFEKVITVEVTSNDMSTPEMEYLLTSFESGEYVNVPQSKRQNWLLGRMAAKRAVEQFIKSKSIILDFSYQIEIERKFRTAPSVRLCTGHNQCKELDSVLLSISHMTDRAVACLVEREVTTGIGVDIEYIRSFPDTTLRSFLTETEYKKFATLPEDEKNEYATLCWCIKEAYMKAQGKGLEMHPRLISVTLDIEQCSAQVHENASLVHAHARWTVKSDSYILVTVLL